jgi:hypothetical protein
MPMISHFTYDTGSDNIKNRILNTNPHPIDNFVMLEGGHLVKPSLRSSIMNEP